MEKDKKYLKSKAVGEPPFLYGMGAYFAIRNAIKAFNSDYTPAFDAPYTNEKVLMDLYHKSSNVSSVEKSKEGSVSWAEA